MFCVCFLTYPHARVFMLCSQQPHEQYVAKGDIWTVMQRVDLDFRFIDSEYRQEEENVRVFIKDVLEKRENDMRYLTLDFRHAVETNENAQKVGTTTTTTVSLQVLCSWWAVVRCALCVGYQ